MRRTLITLGTNIGADNDQIFESMAQPAEFSMISLMASVPPVLPPVDTRVDQDRNPKPLTNPRPFAKLTALTK
jgi:hypothetical protein